MILNFYLRKSQPVAKRHPAEAHNLKNIRFLLRKRGVAGADQMPYAEALPLLAKLVAQEVREARQHTGEKK